LFTGLGAVAMIFANQACIDAIGKFLNKPNPPDVPALQWLNNASANSLACTAELVFAAKADLGIVG
jgi:hypothetical protein